MSSGHVRMETCEIQVVKVTRCFQLQYNIFVIGNLGKETLLWFWFDAVQISRQLNTWLCCEYLSAGSRTFIYTKHTYIFSS